MDFEALGAWFSWILVPLDDVFWLPCRLSRNMRGACQVADLTLMIRATRGRSRRPNHMRSLLDALPTPGPVNFRWFSREFHGVAKQTSFYMAFWSNFRGFGEPKSMPQFDSRAFFFDVIFESVLTSKFGRFLEAQNQKNSNFLMEKQWFSQNQFFR